MSAPPVLHEAEASVGQRLLWLLDRYRGGAGAVNAPLAWRLRGPLDRTALEAALGDLGARHEALRTTFAMRRRRLVQSVHAPWSPPLEVRAGDDDPLAALAAEARAPMDAAGWPLRPVLWPVGDDEHLLLANIHHLATDFSSNGIIARDLARLYEARATGADADLPPVTWQYAQWADRQRQALAGGRLEALERYWREKLAGAELPRLPYRQGTSSSPAAAPSVVVDFEPEMVRGLQAIAVAHRTTRFAVLLAVFFAHLHAVTGQRDLAVASLFANRIRPEVRETVGFFVNMIVLRVALDPDAGFAALVRGCRRTVLEGLARLDLPYQMLPAETVRAGGGSARVDDVVFQYLAEGDGVRGSLRFEPVPLMVTSGRFAVELVVHDPQGCMVRFDAGRIDPEWAAGFVHGFSALAQAVAREPDAPLRVP